jgi:hypothetical protein
LAVFYSRIQDEAILMKTEERYPAPMSEHTNVKPLEGRPIKVSDSSQGNIVKERGERLAGEPGNKPPEIERGASRSNRDLADLLEASLRKVVERSRPVHDLGERDRAENREKLTRRRNRKTVPAVNAASADSTQVASAGIESAPFNELQGPDNFAPLNLRQKLALVRRRLGYIQKRGHNELHNYSYVTAADLAGAVGDIVAELGVLVIPRLESISHEPVRNGSGAGEHLTHVVMNYSFVDIDTAEEITVKIAGEGVDAGDKAPYKAMTGALKYALLQSFLLATGDDPEDERLNTVNHSASPARGSGQLVTAEELHQLRQLIEDTNTELERVLAYYKLASLEEMTQATYRRAIEVLSRKKAKQNGGENAHAQN